MENVEKLKFDSEDFEKYGTKRINIQNGFLKLKKGDFIIIKTEKNEIWLSKSCFTVGSTRFTQFNERLGDTNK